MRSSLIKLKSIKKKEITLITAMIIFVGISAIQYSRIGAKDSLMFGVAGILLSLEIYYLWVNKSKSMLMFIASFPILVTARKVCYFDILFIKVSFESIYITICFLLNLKNIISLIKYYIYKENSIGSNFITSSFLLIVFAYSSSIFSYNIFKSLSYIYITVLIPIMFCLSMIVSFSKDEIYKIIYVLIIGIDLSCIYGITQFVFLGMSLSKLKEHRELLTFGYHNVNIFSGILLSVIPFTLENILYKDREKTKKELYFVVVSFFTQIIALALTMTRGAWIAFLITVLMILISRKYGKILIAGAAIFMVFFNKIITFILHRGASEAHFFQNESMIARLESIFISFKILLKYPFGTGGNNFANLYKKYQLDGYMFMPQNLRMKLSVADYALESAHNLWLQISIDYGLIFALIFFVLIINRIHRAIKEFALNRASFAAIVNYIVISVSTGGEFEHKGIITSTIIIWIIFAIIEFGVIEKEYI